MLLINKLCNKIGKKNFLTFLLLFTITLKAQNLVTNPSFEAGAWPQANSGSADWLTGPTNVFGAENARTGTRYEGESFGQSPAGGPTDFREYIKNTLTTALVPGNTYECSIWVSLSDNYGSYACNSIGFATTTFNPFYAFTQGPIPLTAVYANPGIITSKTGWTQVAGTFVASAADIWVTIGNFNTQAGTSWVFVGPPNGFYYGYYFMDDVCLGPPGACNIILPVELLSFNGKSENRKVKLNWKTATELNCLFFRIERSTDGKTFEEIGKVNGNGTTNSEQFYQFTDENPQYGKVNYYRLREFDTDGKNNYSNMIAIESSGDMNVYINVFPVPAEDNLTIEFNANNQNSVLSIYDSRGNLVNEKSSSGYDKTELSNFKAGYYMAVLLSSDGKTITKKFLVTGQK